jgi:hypothetical protein
MTPARKQNRVSTDESIGTPTNHWSRHSDVELHLPPHLPPTTRALSTRKSVRCIPSTSSSSLILSLDTYVQLTPHRLHPRQKPAGSILAPASFRPMPCFTPSILQRPEIAPSVSSVPSRRNCQTFSRSLLLSSPLSGRSLKRLCRRKRIKISHDCKGEILPRQRHFRSLQLRKRPSYDSDAVVGLAHVMFRCSCQDLNDNGVRTSDEHQEVPCITLMETFSLPPALVLPELKRDTTIFSESHA